MGDRLKSKTKQMISQIFERIEFKALWPVYCDEGGEEFWHDRKGPCQKLGTKLAQALRSRLPSGGRSLYVGAGVAEIPVLTMETQELNREVAVYNLRAEEVEVLNRACAGTSLRFLAQDARTASGGYDHLWIVSVLNDPEQFPTASALSYGRANPVTFNPREFARERKEIENLIGSCLSNLHVPGLVTTSVEETPWITDWCDRRSIPNMIEEKQYPTAIVGDPVCFIRVREQDSEKMTEVPGLGTEREEAGSPQSSILRPTPYA